jgi:hypothetical protein
MLWTPYNIFRSGGIPIADRSGQLIGIIAEADIATRGDKAEETAETVESIS